MMDGPVSDPLLLEPLAAEIPGLPGDLAPQVLGYARHAYGVCRAWDQLLAALNGDDHYYFAVVRHLRVALATGDWSGYRRLLRLEPCRVFEVACGDLHHEVRAYCAHLGQWPSKKAMPAVTSAVLGEWQYCPGDAMRRTFGLARVRWGAPARALHAENHDLCALHDTIVLGTLSELPRGAASQQLLGEDTLDDDATGELRLAHDWAPARFACAAGAPPEAAEVCSEWRRSTAADIRAPPATPEPHAGPYHPSDFGYPEPCYDVPRPRRPETAHERAAAKAQRRKRSRIENALEDLCDTLIVMRGDFRATAPLSRCGRWGAHTLQKFIAAAADAFERDFETAVETALEVAAAQRRLEEEAEARVQAAEPGAGHRGIAFGPVGDKPVRWNNLDGHYDSSSDTEWFAAADAAPEISETDTRELMKSLMADGYFSGEGEEYFAD